MNGLVADRHEILRVMPYGEDFCFLDQICSVDKKNGILTIKGNYLVKEEKCKPHFDVFPGVFKQEAIAQLGVYWLRTQQGFQNHLAMYSGEFSGEDIGLVLPGKLLELEFRLLKFDGRKNGKADGIAKVDEVIVQKFNFSFKIINEKLLFRIIGKRQ